VLVEGISQGSAEQSRGIDQISRALTQMEQVTQNNAASAEQTAAAAEQLTAQSKSVWEVVEHLTAFVGGEGLAALAEAWMIIRAQRLHRQQDPRRERR